MRMSFGRAAAGLSAAAICLAPLVPTAAASAQAANAVPWSQANFHGYASGTEVHVGALPTNTPPLASIDQAVSGATTNSKGLGSTITNELGTQVQPSETSASPALNSYGTGTGLQAAIGSTTPQITLAGQASQSAPPNKPAVTNCIGTATGCQPGLPSQLQQVANASLLSGQGAAVWGSSCVLGQPISYGLGDAAGVGLLDPGTGPIVSTTGTTAATSVSRTTSSTYLSSNGDGTYGLSTQADDIIAPVSVNIPGANVSVQIAVQSAGGVDDPVSLTAKTTGGSTGASVKMSTDDILTVDLVAAGTKTNVITIPLSAVGANGLHIPLATTNLAGTITTLTNTVGSVVSSTPVGTSVGPVLNTVLTNPQVSSLINTVGTTVNQVVNQVATLSLGYIDVDTAPHAIGNPGAAPQTTAGTSASGALDLLHVHVGLSGSAGGTPLPVPTQLANVADLNVGHLETAASLAAPIACGIPVIKSANPTSVTSGQSFTYSIQVPDPNQVNLIDCDMANMTVTDVIKDYSGSPTFKVVSAVDPSGKAGTVTNVSPNTATVTWTGETYKRAASGSPPNPPLVFTIDAQTLSNSPAGVITDTVTAQATAANCQGGATASEANGGALTGSYTLNAPSVTAPIVAPKVLPKALPFTGAMGGPWQPFAGLGLLGLGGGAFALVRRARRLGNP